MASEWPLLPLVQACCPLGPPHSLTVVGLAVSSLPVGLLLCGLSCALLAIRIALKDEWSTGGILFDALGSTFCATDPLTQSERSSLSRKGNPLSQGAGTVSRRAKSDCPQRHPCPRVYSAPTGGEMLFTMREKRASQPIGPPLPADVMQVLGMPLPGKGTGSVT